MSDHALVKLSDHAIKRVWSLMLEEDNLSLKLRTHITGGGCHGFQYGFAFEEEALPDDTLIQVALNVSGQPSLLASECLSNKSDQPVVKSDGSDDKTSDDDSEASGQSGEDGDTGATGLGMGKENKGQDDETVSSAEDGDTGATGVGNQSNQITPVITLLIDPISLQYLRGAEIDFVHDASGERFVIHNPNAKVTCGCARSFAV